MAICVSNGACWPSQYSACREQRVRGGGATFLEQRGSYDFPVRYGDEESSRGRHPVTVMDMATKYRSAGYAFAAIGLATFVIGYFCEAEAYLTDAKVQLGSNSCF